MYGIDVSHHQSPATLPWDTIAASSSFCYVRACYGAGLRDRQCAEHVRRARGVGLQVGLYHFFRPSQRVDDQVAAFRAAALAAKYAVGDLVPVLDIEQDPFPEPGRDVSPAWQEGTRAMLEAFAHDFGGAMVYITQREWGMLGRPAWLLNYPLWVAHYTGAAKPATPGNQPWTIWQHRVAPYLANGPGGHDSKRPELDQNRARGPLPGATRVPWKIVPPDPRSQPPPADQDDDEGLDDALLRAQVLALQVPVAGPLVADGMRELAGLETQPPEGGPDEAA
jgi:lysozyme